MKKVKSGSVLERSPQLFSIGLASNCDFTLVHVNCCKDSSRAVTVARLICACNYPECVLLWGEILVKLY